MSELEKTGQDAGGRDAASQSTKELNFG